MILKKKAMQPAPEGEHAAVCVDVTPIELRDTPWGKKEKFQLRWELEAKQEDGRPHLVVKQYTASLDKKANLRKDLKTWRGRDFTDAELGGFEMEKLIGVPCRLIVTHNDHDGETYANVETVLRVGTVKLAPSGKYTRVKDRDDYKPEPATRESDAAHLGGSTEPEPDPETCPF